MEKLECPNCKKYYKPSNNRQLNCHACQKERRKAKNLEGNRKEICKYCYKLFDVKKYDPFCSELCQTNHNNGKRMIFRDSELQENNANIFRSEIDKINGLA